MSAGTITVQRGDDATLTLDLKNEDGSSYNATGSTLTLTVRKAAGSAVLINKPVSSFTNSGSRATIALTAGELALEVRAYRCEFVLVDALGNRRTSGLNTLLVTEENGQPGTVTLTVGPTQQITVTLSQFVTTPGVPLAGTTGQVLSKSSNANYETEWKTLSKSSFGLGSVDNTSDAAKPVSTAQQAALDAKTDLSTVMAMAVAL